MRSIATSSALRLMLAAGALVVVDPGATPSPISHVAANGLRTQQPVAGGGRSAMQAMIWKYVTRCALRADQELPPSPGADAAVASDPEGRMGLAPEWLGGTCDAACREKVSACLLSLTNRTGRHVMVSLLSGAAGMGDRLAPSDEDRDFPFQEGTFFGDVFSNQAFVCHGRDARKGPQVKRFCALEPASCRGLFPFTDAGACEDVCETACRRLADGTQRCAATVCRDPEGRAWKFPITTYLRNRIEADNADDRASASGDVATYRLIDFGARATARRGFLARLSGASGGGRIEVMLASGRRLGVLPVPASGDAEHELRATLATAGLSGPQDVVLRLSPGLRLDQLSTIEVR